MSRITEYEAALKLDNFVKILTTGERILVNQYRSGRSDYIPPKAKALKEYIEQEGVEVPRVQYNEYRMLEWVGNDKIWRPLNQCEVFNLDKLKKYVSKKLEQWEC